MLTKSAAFKSDPIKLISCLLLLILVIATPVIGDSDKEVIIDSPDQKFHPKEKSPPPNYIPKNPGHYSIQDWSVAIDSTWGPGMTQSEEMDVLTTYWNTIDQRYACFQGLTLDWDSVWVACSTLVASEDLSKGKFVAMLDHASMALKDTHTRVFDDTIHFTQLLPGVPVMVCGDYTGSVELQNFGAALTPLPDSSLLVYRAVDNHPLGLVPGDLVLGYDGIRWYDLYPQLIEARLPIVRYHWGSTDDTYHHIWMSGAGQNWHLFDSIDVVRYATNDTVRLATSPLLTLDSSVFPSEQMDIPGVSVPGLGSSNWISYGMIEGTSIGYIYHWAWNSSSRAAFANAIDALINDSLTTGIIIDGRFDYGGLLIAAWDGLELLFGDDRFTYAFDSRSSTDHFVMYMNIEPGLYFLQGENSGAYDKPIAVLCGPGAVSSGDFVSRTLAWHPMARTFGKSTTGAYSGGQSLSVGHADLNFKYSYINAFVVDTPDVYLTHTDLAIDEPVWLTREGVAAGQDDVVEAAATWIGGFDADGDGILNGDDNCPVIVNPDQTDIDLDGIGDICDDCIDSDFDGFGDPGFESYGCGTDNCPQVPNPTQDDLTNDGVGDACCCVIRGDFNGDGEQDINDLTFVVDYLFRGGDLPPCPSAADIVINNATDISDLTSFVSYLFKGGPAPAPCP